MRHQTAPQIASAEAARHHVEMLRKHLEVLRDLNAPPEMLQVVLKTIAIAEQRVVDLQEPRQGRVALHASVK